MNRPFRRRRRYSDAEVMQAVRRSLDRNSMDAPSGDFFAERVLAAVERAELGEDDPSRARSPRRRVALLPLMAAAAVVVLLAGLVLAVTQLGGGDQKTPSADSRTVSSEPTPSPTDTPTAPSTSPSTKTAVAQSGPSRLTGVKVIDLTFTSDNNGWALASADCLDGKGGACTALMHTTNGHTWISATNPGVNVEGVKQGCAADVCATHIRFADENTGYIYGPGVLYMTTDGGEHWKHQDGGALALESADGTVVRVTSLDPLTVQTADNGSSSWTAHTLPTSSSTASVVGLARQGSRAYLLTRGSGFGSTLFRSSDDGASWSNAGSPCPQVDGDTRYGQAVAVTSGGQVGVLCRVSQTPQTEFAISGDHGAHFTRRAGAPEREGVVAGGADGVYLYASSDAGLQRTTDGGKSWTPVPGLNDPAITFVGFESDSVARVVGDNGATIWTTHDGGKTWDPVRFG